MITMYHSGAFTCYFELSNFLLKSGLSYFSFTCVSSVVGATGCHCFDL